MDKRTHPVKRALRSMAKDWWMVLLDILAVNVAYFLALFIRYYYIGYALEITEYRFFDEFLKIAPVNSVLAVIIFAAFRLYNGMWKYAGMNDLNRIVMANLASSLLHVVTSFLVRRMPLSYYLLGAVLQMVFIVTIRFAYRMVRLEKRKVINRRNPGLRTMIIGAGEAGRRVMRAMEDGDIYQAACFYDTKNETGASVMNGIPVENGAEDVESLIRYYQIQAVILADPLLQPDFREKVKRICEKENIKLDDMGYAFYLSVEEAFDGPVELDKKPDAPAEDRTRTIPFSPPDISEAEIAEVTEALRSGWITTGPRTKLLERRLAAYIETGRVDVETEADPKRWSNRVACLNSATAAEELNLRILGIGPGDEVIVPAYTYTATASAVVHVGAKPVFVDIQKDGDPITHMPEMDYDKLEAAITPRTKAIVAVDLSGIVCDYDRIFAIAEKKKDLFTPVESDGTPLSDLSSRIQHALGRIAVLSDCAHALGASHKVTFSRAGSSEMINIYCGAIADFTSFSFHAVKNFTTAEGGAATWRKINGIENKEIYRFYQLLSLHGQSKDALAKTKAGAWEYDIVGPWYKCNMTDIMAAIGLRQLDRYPRLLQRRSDILKKYDAVCEELGISHLVHHTENMDSSNHLYMIRIPGIDEETRNQIITVMAEKGVVTNVHYKPLPMMTAYGADCSEYPNSYDYYRNLITLPLHTLLSEENVERVCQTLKEALTEVLGANHDLEKVG